MPTGIYKDKTINRSEIAKKAGIGKWMKGRPSKFKGMLGKKFSEETRLKMSNSAKGRISPMRGRKHTEESKKKMSLASKGKPKSEEHIRKAGEAQKGRKFSEEAKQKMSDARKRFYANGGKNWNWIEDRTKLVRQEERGGPRHKEWSLSIKKRDNWKCKINNDNCSGRIESHHILGWIEYPELRYNINNGIALCLAHHPRKRAEEKRLILNFQELVSVSN